MSGVIAQTMPHCKANETGVSKEKLGLLGKQNHLGTEQYGTSV
jgi:hypothetical protein